jgi:hypothetical protein
MKKQQVPWLVMTIMSLALAACDDVINIDTNSAAPVLNIDAWVNSKPETQTIYLTMSQDYFDNTNLPPAASGATVSVKDNFGNVYVFAEDMQSADGAYRWVPQEGAVLAVTGRTYTLIVSYAGETFEASCKVGRVPAIDSLTYSELDRGLGRGGNDETFYRGEFWATDPPGKGDTYWIRTYKNGVLLSKPSELNIAYDASRVSGSEFDGVTFTTQVRVGINASETDADDKQVSPVLPGDSLYVEIHSLTEASFNYMNEVLTQTDRNGGIAELFASRPLANVSTNIVNLDGNGSPVVGFFNISVVSGLGKTFRP